jgi:flagellar biosynthesis anti-sigma factor FlgM
MKVDLTNFAAEVPDNGKSSRAVKAGTSGEIATSGAAPGAASNIGSSSAANIGSNLASNIDLASFSFDQSRVRSLAAQVLAEPEIRQAKVQLLQQAIGNSQYSVSPGQIADALAKEFAFLPA